MFSAWSVPKSFLEDNWRYNVGKYKRLKLGGGQAYERSSV
jgi:hypothetical protein